MQQTQPQDSTSNVSELLADAILDAKVEELKRSIQTLYMRIDELISLKSKAR